jgi:glycerol-1-phosphate dehydrogenase [NAD(P)+]
VAAAWEIFLAELDLSELDHDRLFPCATDMEPMVRRVFAGIDPSGRVGEECWSDYRKKLALWQESRPWVEGFFAEWAEHRAKLKEMVMPPATLGSALKRAGAPALFGELDPPVRPGIARWAPENCHLMRNRFTLADVLFYAAQWDDAFVERLLERAPSFGGGL